MNCFHPDNFMKIAQIIKIYHTQITSIIITSEDQSVINYIKSKYNGFGLDLIFNDGDMLQNCGLVQDLNEEQKSNEFEMFKILISMISTLKLQMHSNYYIIQKQSNWGHSIWTISSCIYCGIYHKIIKGTDKYCINVETLKKTMRKTLYWDYRLFDGKDGDIYLSKLTSSMFKNDVNIVHDLTINVTENSCYRKDRYDFKKN